MRHNVLYRQEHQILKFYDNMCYGGNGAKQTVLSAIFNHKELVSAKA